MNSKHTGSLIYLSRTSDLFSPHWLKPRCLSSWSFSFCWAKQKFKPWEPPWWSSDKTLFPLQGAWVQSLVRELRSHMLCNVPKNKYKLKKIKTMEQQDFVLSNKKKLAFICTKHFHLKDGKKWMYLKYLSSVFPDILNEIKHRSFLTCGEKVL